MVEGIDRKLIVVFRDQHLIAALLEIIDCGAGCRLQGGNGLRFLVAAFPACPRLIFKYHEEAARSGFPCADPVNKRQIVLLQQAAVFIGLLRHFLLHDLPVPVQVGTLGNDLDLHFDRADLQKRDERVDDVPLLSGAAQQEVDRYDLNDLQVAVIPCVDDAVFDLLHGQVLRHGIDVLGCGVTALGFMLPPFLPPALFLFIACNNAAVMEVFQDKEDERGQAFAVDAHQCDNAQRQCGQAQNDDLGCQCQSGHRENRYADSQNDNQCLGRVAELQQPAEKSPALNKIGRDDIGIIIICFTHI